MTFLRNALQPAQAVAFLSQQGPSGVGSVYAPGFEDIFETMPAIDPRREDPEALRATIEGMTRMVTRALESNLVRTNLEAGRFERTYLALEEPRLVDGLWLGGTEVFMAHWGQGFRTPVHGHAPGFINEQVIAGAVMVTDYETVARPADRLAVGIRSTRQGPGRFAAYFEPDRNQEQRSAMIHHLEALEPTTTIHYVPEHARNGRGNRFQAIGNHFNGAFSLSSAAGLTRVTGEEALHSKVGEVYLVRSKNVAHLTGGDHAMLIVGGLVQKNHGLRPNDAVFPLGDSPLRDYLADEDLVLLKLGPEQREAFYDHFSIAPEFRIGAA